LIVEHSMRRYLAVLIAAAAVAAAGAGVVLPLTGSTPPTAAALFATPEAAYGPAAATVAALLLWRRAGNRIAWLLLVSGLAAGLYVLGRARPGEPVCDWLAAWTWAPAYLVPVAVLPLLWPDGRLPSRRWRPAFVLAAGLPIVVSVGAAVEPAAAGHPAAPMIAALRTAFPFLVPVTIGLGVAALVTRFRHAGPVGRRQIAWFGYAVTVVGVLSFAGPWWLRLIASTAVPVAIAVAVTRYRLYDIDLLVSRTLAAALVVGALALVYAAAVGWLGALLFGDRDPLTAFAGAMTVALAFAPVRDRVRRGVDRLLFGARADPYRLLTAVTARLQQAPSPPAALRLLAEEVATALRLPTVSIDLSGAGPADARELRLPLDWFGEPIGELRAAPRPGAERLDPADVAVLRQLAHHAAALAYAVRLTADLQSSRERVVTAREEERRRLRRDLHDGLGPQLAGVVMGLDAAASSLSRADHDRAAGLIADARDQARTAVEDIRRLVRGLRPPALDDLGLLEALRTTGPAAHGGVEIEASGDLAALPAAVEVAAFRLVQEAVTNAVRHAGAATVTVRLDARPGDLEVVVADDGIGIAEDAAPGVGLRSMRERVAELGGSLEVRADPGGGTRVRAVLPAGAVAVEG
jgi:signal transduction histidine kinase